MTRGILLAGTQSGVGKTTVSIGIMSLLSNSHRVVPFKVGPDYIDLEYHQMVCGTKGYNLDLFLLGQQKVKDLFQSRAGRGDVAIVEGVMGLFDGLGEEGFGSSAQIAKMLSLPVVLVVDARGMARSVSALVRGFRDFDKDVQIVGVFLNRVRNDRHIRLLQQCIERDTGLPVVGFLPEDPDLVFPERHLGLVPVGEVGVRDKIERIRETVSQHFDRELFLRVMGEIQSIPLRECPREKIVRVGLAYDEAFHFYYHSSLECLEEEGIEFVPFSPLKDERLPEGISGLYLGGGFPEVFASQLHDNRRLAKMIRQVVIQGMPVYGECGGLMYLSQEIWVCGERFSMVGVFPFTVEMTTCLQRFGYAEAVVLEENVLALPGTVLRGHEFHYSRIKGGSGRATYQVRRPSLGRYWSCGFVERNVLATYLHIDFFGFPQAAKRFARACQSFKRAEVS